LSYTWLCEGCGKTGTKPLSYEQAQEAGQNHARGQWGHGTLHSNKQLKKCDAAKKRVIFYGDRKR
jgi:hypothetical protein